MDQNDNKEDVEAEAFNNMNNARIQSWFMKCGEECPSPHYHAEDSEDLEVVQDKAWNPRDFKKHLQQCSVCQTKGTPEKTLHCIKSHLKAFCWFCYATLDFKAKSIEDHNRDMGHFLDETKQLVPCPFRNCPGSECFNSQFYYMSSIRCHIMKVHLPELDTLIQKTEAVGVGEDEKQKDCNTSSSGYGSGATVSRRQSAQNDDTKNRNGKMKFPVPSHSATILQQTGATNTVFVCSLCETVFRYRLGMLNHQCRQVCPFMKKKFCSYCGCGFEGFSILACINHLRFCRT